MSHLALVFGLAREASHAQQCDPCLQLALFAPLTAHIALLMVSRPFVELLLTVAHPRFTVLEQDVTPILHHLSGKHSFCGDQGFL